MCGASDVAALVGWGRGKSDVKQAWLSSQSRCGLPLPEHEAECCREQGSDHHCKDGLSERSVSV